MDESFELLSSMSPKVKKNATKQNKNPKSKGPSKLALRRYFRKSIGFDSLKKTKDNSLLCLNDNEDEEEDDDRSSDESYKGKIIADSFEQEEEKDKENEKETIEDSFIINGKFEKSDLNTKTETKAANYDFDEQRLDEINDIYIETDKYRQIENWIANIPSQQEQSFYSSSYRHFIEEKKIEDNIEKVKQEELNKNNFDDDDDVIVIEDSVVIEGNGNSDAENKEDDHKNKNVVIEILDSPLMLREKEREESDCGDESEHNISIDRFMENINKKKNDKDTNHSNLLLSEPRHKKHLEVPRNQVTQTERKINPRQNLHKALFNKAKMMQNLESPAFDPLNSKEKKNNKSSDMCKKLDFSNEDEDKDNNKENAQNAKNNSQLDLTDSESLLDKLYGTSWRANREEILTPIKPNKPNKNSIFSSTMKTREQPQKQGDIKEKTRKAKFNLSLSSNEDEKERRKDINLILTPPKLNTNKTSNKNNNNNKNKLSPIINKSKKTQQKENNKKGKENNDLNVALSQLKINNQQDIKQNQNDNKKNVYEGKKNKSNTNIKGNKIKKNVFSSFSSDSNSNSDSEEESFIKLPKKTPRKKILSSSSSEQSLHTIESNTEIDTDAELKRVNNYLYNRFLNTENWQEPVYKKKNEEGEEKSKAIKKLDDKKKKESKNEKATTTTNTTTKKTKNNKSKGEEAIPVSINQVQNQKQSGGNEEEKYPSFLASLSPNIKVSDIKLKYRPYRNNFKEHKVQLARKLFDYFNENVFDNKIPKDTPLDWNDKMRGTAGYCKCRKVTRRTGVVERNCVIELATKILTSADRLRDTLIHEMCHAATFIVNEISDGHGPLWQSWTHKAMTRFPELPKISRCHDYKISTKYSYVCTKCGYTIGRHSKSLDIERKRCGYCYGTFEVFINKKKGGVDVKVPVKSTKETSGFALFVKENYGKVRTPAVTHGEAMKILGQQFSELKMK